VILKCKNTKKCKIKNKCCLPLYTFTEKVLPLVKEIVERRHGEPIKFLFLPKMGLLGSQAGNEKKCWM
jgi:hypothetical protein